MALTWKDGVATLLALFIVFLYWAQSNDFDLPFVSGYRLAIVLASLIGIVMTRLESFSNFDWSSPLIPVPLALFSLAVLAIIGGLATGNEFSLALLSMVIILFWVFATLRHLFDI